MIRFGQRIWRLKDDPGFFERLSGEQVAPWSNLEALWAFAVWLKGDPPVCLSRAVSEYEAPESPVPFAEFLAAVEPRRLYDFAFALTCYCPFEMGGSQFVSHRRSRHNWQAFLRRPGINLWHAQFESLHLLVDDNYSDAVQFRKDRGARKTSWWDYAKNLKLTPSLSLLDVVDQRLIFPYTYSPPLRRARLLLEAWPACRLGSPGAPRRKSPRAADA